MNRPTKNWTRTRLAVLDRARRTAIKPLEILYPIHMAVCMYYFVGLMRFKFFNDTTSFTLDEAIQLVTVATAGMLVPILTGAVLTLHFASRRFQILTTT